ncbi:exodeoxyribonuclease V subunit beta [Aromatoleum diolicum]|uniref:RecBCD enzyme subunit RecB n=1 Tax=Aromatoleum diolicum TaxID=75796 RepID=A0ABX1QHI9_9RHOO|nr:exodeoxyribonuclease V subunit beta [Aromatoleum diolicum]NMG77443.1 exodeoxyribonuclease V subunit beta [Aromatoleum diolicum]
MNRDMMPATLPQALEPLRFPLHGSRLIEASAGTGKTFTIAALYVRLVLGHGGHAAFARPLTPPEILVVTFTDAATKELRDRIRARLAEAAGCFLADPATVAAQAAGADFLHALRAEYPPGEWLGCARKLQLAAEWMDEAAVSTIHGWCKRMLSEHAFDSDSLFTQRLETDQRELLAEVVRDYWRTFHTPLAAPDVAEVMRWWATPEALQGDLRGLFEHAAALDAAVPPAQAIRAACAQKAGVLAQLKAPWGTWADELETLLDGAVAARQVVGSKIQRRYYAAWLDALRTWAADPAAESLDLKKGWARLTPAGLAEAWKDGAPPAHPALDAMTGLQAALAHLPDARAPLLCFAARWVAQRFADEQARRAQMGFNDLLTRLDTALHERNGERLAEVIRTQFPVALIDEFQDTDPVQYRIFDAVYRIADNAPDTGLVLIGDPKQAIYAFRGADIFTYLAARRATGGRLYTLDTNYRSTVAMVAAVNRCFAQAEAREAGTGAFLFRGPDDNPVPFHAVHAQGRREAFVADDSTQYDSPAHNAPAAALTCWTLAPEPSGKPLAKGAYIDRMAAACAGEIVRLLNLGLQGRAGFAASPDAGGGEMVRLRPADIAILVNNRNEAAAVRQALAAGGVRSVYLSDQESVFASPQAGELQLWLAACAEPDDDGLLRAALATPSLGLDWPALDRLRHDELAWEARVLQFRDYRQCWRLQGVLPMLRRLLGDFDVPRRLLAPAPGASNGDGERALTDLLHLAELLQHASAALDGEHALIRHLAEQRADAGNGDDARKVRLESDADLVQVVTIHKSKGLEYPLVFLPFACAFRPTKGEDLPLKWHDDSGRLQLALAADDAALARADRERLGEDLRKFYVALTRARHATWLGFAPVADLHRSAPGYLLAGGAAIGPDRLDAVLGAMSGGCAGIVVTPAPEASDVRYHAGAAHADAGAARQPRRAVREHWWIASYSSLRVGEGRDATADVQGVAGALPTGAAPPPSASQAPRRVTDPLAPHMATHIATAPAADTAAEATFAETLDEAPVAGALAPTDDDARLHHFARGAGVGTFLHELLEWAAREGFGRIAAQPARARDTVARRCAVRGWSHWSEPLSRWLQHFIAMPLPLPDADSPPAPCLAALSAYQVEMEFWFETHRADTVRLDALVRAHTLGGAPRPALLPGQLNGMLKGFIDLVFEHQGRYYVADYKSNWLGPDDAAYTSDAMREAVLAKRYDLQYVLYLFALHRLLRSRLPDYDYDRHVGGAVYLFLRGSHAETRGLHCERPPRVLIEALDAEFGAAGAEVRP